MKTLPSIHSGCALAASLTLLLASLPARAAILHVTDGDHLTVQGYDTVTGAQVYSTAGLLFGGLYAVAVTATTVSVAAYSNHNTQTLSLGGSVLTSGTYAGAVLGDEVDGTTDGQYFYTSTWLAPLTVRRYDQHWENPVTVFTASGVTTTFNYGIAYDSVNNTMWLSNQNTIYQYSMAGTQLSSFAHGGGLGSLAIDNSAGTLWYTPNVSTANLLQYSKTGTLLTSLQTVTRAGNVLGSEIAYVAPEPTSGGLLGAGTLLLTARRRRNPATR